MKDYERDTRRLRDAITRHRCRCCDRLETMPRGEIDKELWAEVMREEMGQRRWVCNVAASGRHNGATCRPDDPHGPYWGCGWKP